MSDEPARRTIRDGPFCWQGKEALRRIGEHFAESNKVASARSVYLALCELASNEASERFQAKVATVAKFAWVSPRTVHDVLPEMAFIKVVHIERRTIPGSKMDAPSFYTLTHCNDCAPVGNGCIPLCNQPEQTSVAENQKNNQKKYIEEREQKKTNPEPLASGKVQFSPSLVDEIYLEYPRKKKRW